MDIKTLLMRARRLLVQAKKPTKKEFEFIAKVTGLGMIIIGVIGVIISAIAGVI